MLFDHWKEEQLRQEFDQAEKERDLFKRRTTYGPSMPPPFSVKDRERLKVLEKLRSEWYRRKEVNKAENPRIREISREIEENLTQINKLMLANELLEGSRRSYEQECDREFGEKNPQDFDEREYLSLRRRSAEDELSIAGQKLYGRGRHSISL